MTVTTRISGVATLLANASAVFLDFNGTLSDDEELLAELISEVSLEKLGLPLDRDRYFTEFVGKTEAEMFHILAQESAANKMGDNGDLVTTFNCKYLERVRLDQRISPDAKAFVREARRRGKAIAVVTSASRDVVVPTLDHLNLLESIDTVIAVEDVARPKPAPDCYLHASEMLRVPPAEAVVFEDSRTGLSSALAAGIVSVVVGEGLSDDIRARYTPFAVSELHPRLFGR